MKGVIISLLSVVFACRCVSAETIGNGDIYDIVISNGRVIDPETRFDSTGFNVGIRGEEISVITENPINGKVVIDATGKVVSPGFIDILSYDPNDYGVWYKIADGVTTNLSMHGGTVDADKWYERFRRQKTPLNFGAGFFYNGARLKLAIGPFEKASKKDIEKLAVMAESALRRGALGVGMSLEYAPGTSSEEVEAMMRVAKPHNAPVFFHLRYSDMEPPGTNIEALSEVIGLAKKTGAAVHIDHINSTGGTFSMKESLKILMDAAKDGVDITACAYPYPYWATYLDSARFNKGWQKRFRIDYKDLQIGGTNERLREESFRKYRKLGRLAVAYAIPEQDVLDALYSPLVMLGSDGIMEPGNNNHPRAAGAFTRLLSLYVREKNAITLMEAIEKMTIMPAKRLEKRAPLFKKMGRLQAGSHADIVVFDPARVQDKGTVEKPNQFSEGMDYVLINGSIVKDPLGLHKDVRAGKPIKGREDL